MPMKFMLTRSKLLAMKVLHSKGADQRSSTEENNCKSILCTRLSNFKGQQSILCQQRNCLRGDIWLHFFSVSMIWSNLVANIRVLKDFSTPVKLGSVKYSELCPACYQFQAFGYVYQRAQLSSF